MKRSAKPVCPVVLSWHHQRLLGREPLRWPRLGPGLQDELQRRIHGQPDVPEACLGQQLTQACLADQPAQDQTGPLRQPCGNDLLGIRLSPKSSGQHDRYNPARCSATSWAATSTHSSQMVPP
jgi:hypothetical protein